jgi:cysteine synthase A
MKEFGGKMIVAILPDAGERYLTGPLFEGLFDETGLPRI